MDMLLPLLLQQINPPLPSVYSLGSFNGF